MPYMTETPQKPLPPVIAKLESFALGLQARIEKVANPKRKFHFLAFTPYEADRINYVGFNDRMVASTIDTIISCVLLYRVLSIIAAFIFGPERAALLYGLPVGAPNEELIQAAAQQGFARDWLLNNLLYMIIFAAPIIGCWVYASTTPGKWIFQMRVVDATTGKPLTLRQSCIRYLGYMLCTFTLFIGFLWIIKDPKKQGWHDKLANTVVIRIKTWRLPEADESAFPEALRPTTETAPETIASEEATPSA